MSTPSILGFITGGLGQHMSVTRMNSGDSMSTAAEDNDAVYEL